MLESFQNSGNVIGHLVLDFLIADYSSWKQLGICDPGRKRSYSKPDIVMKTSLHPKRLFERKKAKKSI